MNENKEHITSVGMFVTGKESKNWPQALTPSSCGMLVYNDVTSMVTKRLLSGMVPIVVNLFRKSVVSRI